MNRLIVDRISTPLGELLIVSDEQQRLRAVEWLDYEARMMKLLHQQYPHRQFERVAGSGKGKLVDCLQRYFAGEVAAIADLPTQTGGTAFQQQVWRELRRIPCGQTISYGALAARLGRPTAARAVGMANGSNPISIVVPCHRVIGANGTLTGYAGGVERKRWLLKHEGYSLPD